MTAEKCVLGFPIVSNEFHPGYERGRTCSSRVAASSIGTVGGGTPGQTITGIYTLGPTPPLVR